MPIVNLLSDRAHPLQALADALTMERAFGPLAGRRVAWVGDYNNVARSLGEITARLGGHVAYACPPGFEPSAAELERLLLLGAASAEHHWRPADAVKGADAVHADTWVSMGQEEEKAARVQAFEGFTVDEALMGHAAPEAVFMHCLPAYRGLGGDGRGDRRTAEPGVRARPRPPPRRPRRLGVPAREVIVSIPLASRITGVSGPSASAPDRSAGDTQDRRRDRQRAAGRERSEPET